MYRAYKGVSSAPCISFEQGLDEKVHFSHEAVHLIASAISDKVEGVTAKASGTQDIGSQEVDISI